MKNKEGGDLHQGFIFTEPFPRPVQSFSLNVLVSVCPPLCQLEPCGLETSGQRVHSSHCPLILVLVLSNFLDNLFFGLAFFGMFTLRVQSRGLITLDSGWGLFVQPAAQLRDEDEDVDNDNEEEDNNDNDDYDDEANHNHPN